MGTNIQYLIERLYRFEWGEPITFHEVIRRMYIDKDMSIRDISEEIGISVGAIHNYIKDEGIVKSIKCKR